MSDNDLLAKLLKGDWLYQIKYIKYKIFGGNIPTKPGYGKSIEQRIYEKVENSIDGGASKKSTPESDDAFSENYNSYSKSDLLEALWGYCGSGDVDDVAAILKAGANINATDDDGYSGLMHAAYSGYPDVVELLVKKNADKNIKSKDGENQTALDIAKVNLEEDENNEDLKKIITLLS